MFDVRRMPPTNDSSTPFLPCAVNRAIFLGIKHNVGGHTYDGDAAHKDGYTRANGKRTYVMLGAGDLPIVDLLAALKADGYDSYLSLEWEKMWCPELEEPERVFPHFTHKLNALWDAL